MANNLIGRMMSSNEPLDEWDVVETPSQDEMQDFRGTAPDSNLQYRPGQNTIASNGGELGGHRKLGATSGTQGRFTGTKEEVCQDCNTHHNYFRLGSAFEVSWCGQSPEANSEQRDSQKPVERKQQSRKQQSDRDQLYPCSSCHGYHYTSSCIYLRTWTEWLDYHCAHMPSQPFPYTGSLRNLFGCEAAPGDDEITILREKASDLDATKSLNRPNYISNTRIKADMMTRSGREMWYEDEEWEITLNRKKGKQPVDIRWGSSLAGRDDNENDRWEGADDEEDELASLRADLGRKLPRTSRATIFDDGW